MEGLMYICENWGHHKCQETVAKLMSAKELRGGENIPLLPVGEELKKIDEICKNCSDAHFEISERKCPIDDSENVQAFRSFVYGPGLGTRTIYNYKCEDCGRVLFATKKLP